MLVQDQRARSHRLRADGTHREAVSAPCITLCPTRTASQGHPFLPTSLVDAVHHAALAIARRSGSSSVLPKDHRYSAARDLGPRSGQMMPRIRGRPRMGSAASPIRPRIRPTGLQLRGGRRGGLRRRAERAEPAARWASGGIPAAVAVVQHLYPRHRSLMADILSRAPSSAKQAEENDKLGPDPCTSLPQQAPPGQSEGHPLSLTQSELVHFVRPSADLLFESIAAKL